MKEIIKGYSIFPLCMLNIYKRYNNKFCIEIFIA